MEKNGVCCACGYDGDEETPCPNRDDATHCVHWWEADDDDDEDLDLMNAPDLDWDESEDCAGLLTEEK